MFIEAVRPSGAFTALRICNSAIAARCGSTVSIHDGKNSTSCYIPVNRMLLWNVCFRHYVVKYLSWPIKRFQKKKNTHIFKITFTLKVENSHTTTWRGNFAIRQYASGRNRNSFTRQYFIIIINRYVQPETFCLCSDRRII